MEIGQGVSGGNALGAVKQGDTQKGMVGGGRRCSKASAPKGACATARAATREKHISPVITGDEAPHGCEMIHRKAATKLKLEHSVTQYGRDV